MRRQRTERFTASLLPLALVVLGLATVTVTLMALVELPKRLVLHDLGSARLPPTDLAKAINDARAILVQGLVGLAFFAGAFLTWRQLRVTREEQSSRVVDGLPCMITRRLPGLVLVA